MDKEIKEYELNTIEDLLSLEEDAFDRMLIDLKGVKASYNLVVAIHKEAGVDKPKLALPLLWIDDGKNDITMNVDKKQERE